MFLIFFFLFEIPLIDSDIYLIYDDKINYKINLNNVNSIELKEALNTVELNVYAYYIKDKIYYVKDIDELVSIYIEDKDISSKIYYLNYGIKIDSVIVNAEDSQIDKLREKVSFY